MSETSELIRRLRSGGLTQTEISKRTGIPQSRLSRWENGSAPDSADDALKLKALVDGLKKPAKAPAALTIVRRPEDRRGEPRGTPDRRKGEHAE